MVSRIARRLLSVIPILFLVSIILFIMMNILPGDASINTIESVNQEYLDRIRAEMGLDKPAIVRYLSWLSDLVRGDLGSSLLSYTPITTLLKERIPATIELTLASMLFAVVFALPIGILSAVKRNSGVDVFSSVFSMLGIAMPSFWMGILLILLFSVQLNWLPASGYVSIFKDPLQNISHMIMPAFAIGFAFAATVMRQTRSALLEVLGQDFVLTARAKGLREKVVIWKHALRNALIPVVTVISMQIGRLIGGAVVTEQIFALPGVGRLIVEAILSRDYPVVMSSVLVVAATVILINTFVDVLYIVIDPRISHGSKYK